MNNQDPNWKTNFELAYFFEREQKLKFKVMDLDDVNADDLIGEAETKIGSILGSRAAMQQLELTANGAKNRGKITVRIESVAESNMSYQMDFEFKQPGNRVAGCCGTKVLPVAIQFQRKVAGNWVKAFETAALNRN